MPQCSCQWGISLRQNSYIFIQQNVVCQLTALLCRSPCVKHLNDCWKPRKLKDDVKRAVDLIYHQQTPTRCGYMFVFGYSLTRCGPLGNRKVCKAHCRVAVSRLQCSKYSFATLSAQYAACYTVRLLCGITRVLSSMIDHPSLQWRQNRRDCVSNHQPHHCSLSRLSKKTSKLRVTGLCAGNSPGPVNSPHKWPVARKMFPFDDVIMLLTNANGTGTRHDVDRLSCLLSYGNIMVL